MTDLLDYVPAQRHSPTSQAAAEAIRPSAATLRMQVLGYIVARGDEGATDDEIQIALGIEGSTQRPRRVELLDRGLVKDSGATRATRKGRQAAVWVRA